MKPYQFVALWILLSFYGTDEHGWIDLPFLLFAFSVYAYECWRMLGRPFGSKT